MRKVKHCLTHSAKVDALPKLASIMAQVHSSNSADRARNDSAITPKERLELATVQAENCLIAGDFSAAAAQAEDILKRVLYVTGAEVLQTHASYALLQASYELDRYSWLTQAQLCVWTLAKHSLVSFRLNEAERFLLQYYGKLTSFDPQVLLLW